MDGALRFLSCAPGAIPAPIADPSGAASEAWEELGGDDRTVPALLRLAGDTVLEVRHAAPDGGGCEDLREGGLVHARGNEPFWHLRVLPESASMSTPDLVDGVPYVGGAWDRPDSATWTYRSSDDSVTLRLRERRCRDSMSGAWFPFEAEATWRGRVLEGCALEGRAAERLGAP